MKVVYCDGCKSQVVLQENNTKPRRYYPHDFCLDCYLFLEKEFKLSFDKLRSDPEKYKIKYEF